MGAHQDPVQRAVVLILAVVCTLLDGAFDTLVGVAVHGNCLLYFGFADSMCGCRKMIPERITIVAFVRRL